MIGVHLTLAEYAECEQRAGSRTLNKWARSRLLRQSDDPTLEKIQSMLQVLVEEVLAIRTMMLNFSLTDGTIDGPKGAKALAAEVDAEKQQLAKKRLESA